MWSNISINFAARVHVPNKETEKLSTSKPMTSAENVDQIGHLPIDRFAALWLRKIINVLNSITSLNYVGKATQTRTQNKVSE